MNKVSIIIPTYRRTEYIDRAISSVLGQTYPNIEIIVVDDNGDGTPERDKMINMMEKYKNNPKVRYIKNDINLGGAAARNVGIDQSTGCYITFLDDDDEYMPTKIEVQYNEMIKHGWDVSIMDGATYNSKGELLSRKKQRISQNPGYEELIVAHLLHRLTNTNTFMYKSGRLRAIGGFDDIVAGQEYILMLKTINARLNLGYIPQTLVSCYIYGSERLSTGVKKLIAEKIIMKENRKYFKYLNGNQRRQVLCRHHSVLCFVQLKRRKFVQAFGQAISAFICSPIQMYRLYLEYKGKLTA